MKKQFGTNMAFVWACARTLRKNYPAKPFHLIGDRRFTSLPLIYFLKDNLRLSYTGTAMRNRKGLPPLEKIKERGESSSFYLQIKGVDIGLTQWKDNSEVIVITSEGTSDNQSVKRRIGQEITDITAPKTISIFNTNMNAIDRFDQSLRTDFCLEKTGRTKKAYRKISDGCIDIAIAASYRYKRSFVEKNERYSQMEFLENLHVQLTKCLAENVFNYEVHMQFTLSNARYQNCEYCYFQRQTGVVPSTEMDLSSNTGSNVKPKRCKRTKFFCSTCNISICKFHWHDAHTESTFLTWRKKKSGTSREDNAPPPKKHCTQSNAVQ